jgi:ribulose-5-phosphate 4-epimerase/fuculose-1-phosphate aldolase
MMLTTNKIVTTQSAGFRTCVTTMPQQESPFEAALSDLIVANRILAAEGVLDGFGHVSIRDPRDPACYLMSRSLAPALVTAADIIQHDLDNKPTQDHGHSLYYERWIHGEIYKARPPVNAIVHSHSPTVVPFASTKAPLRPILHNASFLGFGTPVFEIRNFIPNSDLMISTAALGKALAQALGPTADVILLRGHGNVVVGPTLQIAVFRAYYTEINARQQLNAMMLGPNDVVYMNAGECETTDKVMQSVAGRPWDLWKRRVRREMRRAETEDRL